MPRYEMAADFASEQPPTEMQQLLATISRSQDATYCGLFTGSVVIPDFLAAENPTRIVQAAGAGE